eukprot:Tamp_29005.p2 GENE.Tamp_29005~~Tamp_29005.p2  ORF type:complete len:204 (+),score=24.70 Tamp_29005:104-715(+)
MRDPWQEPRRGLSAAGARDEPLGLPAGQPGLSAIDRAVPPLLAVCSCPSGCFLLCQCLTDGSNPAARPRRPPPDEMRKMRELQEFERARAFQLSAAGPSAPGERKRPGAARDAQGDEGKVAKRSALASLSSLRGVTIVRRKGAGAQAAGKPLPVASDPAPDGGGGAGGAAALGMLADYGSDSDSEPPGESQAGRELESESDDA